MYWCCRKFVTETVQREIFTIFVQSEKLIVLCLLAMDWVEVVATVVVIVIVLNAASYWGAMFILEIYITRYLLVVL